MKSSSMSAGTVLPKILISALHEEAAATIIASLIEDTAKSEGNEDNSSEPFHSWLLKNKYYTARVSLVPYADDGPVPDLSDIEAHVIYLTEEECTSPEVGAAAIERRAAAAQGEAEVRLVLAEALREDETLAGAARGAGYELVPLREEPEVVEGEDNDEDEVEMDLYGIPRARAALHAHIWPGLQRVGRPGNTHTQPSHEELMVENAELFAEALGALGEVRDLSPTRRRDHADAVMGAFCRALGLDLEDL